MNFNANSQTEKLDSLKALANLYKSIHLFFLVFGYFIIASILNRLTRVRFIARNIQRPSIIFVFLELQSIVELF